MQIIPTSESPAAIDAECLSLGVFDGEMTPPFVLEHPAARSLVSRLFASKDVATGLGDATFLHGVAGVKAGSLLIFGLGPRDHFTPGSAFRAGVSVGKRLAGKPRERIAVVPPTADMGTDLDAAAIVSAFLEGMIVGTRGPDLKKSEPTRHPFRTLIVASPFREDDPRNLDLGALLHRAQIVGEAVNLARDLVNTPPSEKPPTRLADRAREVAESAGVVVEVWGLDQIQRERFGGLLGVSAGSTEPPSFVILRYRGAGGNAPRLSLVGKGVTFDSGGLSLKPSASMEDMKADMSGAATVLATIQAAARLGLAVDLDGYLILTENMTGGAAMKLGDVLTTRDGKTVEVLNTDAEGRLILADALSYAAEQHPGRVLDLATLTGACVVALGTQVAGLFSNDEEFAHDLQAACRRTGERTWRLPLDDDYDDLLKSHVADLKNVGGKWGGAITAAKFLQRFVGSTPWVHLDIAGPSWADTETATRDVGASGCFVRSLVVLLETEAER